HHVRADGTPPPGGALGRPAAGQVGLEPSRARCLVARGQHAVATPVDVDDRHPVRTDHPAGVHDDRGQQVVHVGGTDQLGRRLQHVHTGIVQGVADTPHLFDGDPVDLPHLVDEEIDQRVVGQLDDQFVDGLAAVALEDVDADDVATHRADTAGDL